MLRVTNYILFVLLSVQIAAIESALANSLPGFSSGHLKSQFVASQLDRQNLFYATEGHYASTLNLDARFNFAAESGPWRMGFDYNLQAAKGSGAKIAQSQSPLLSSQAINDERRWWDLTSTLKSGDDYYLLHRLDRLHLSYVSANHVFKLGRQAVSWGNGMLFNPVDFLNPFDPTAIDKEYKVGDDMLYYQYLTPSGNDIQLVRVQRSRLPTDNGSDVHSSAIKYQAFYQAVEYNLLLAEHYDDMIVALGWRLPVADALLQGDISVVRTDSQEVVNGVVNLSYSLTLKGHNLSLIGEYYYNGFGSNDTIVLESLDQQPDLLNRLLRGELYNTGSQYLAFSGLLETSPLHRVTTSVFVNLNDTSALMQFTGQYDLQQDMQFIAALNLPLGPKGTEYGGLYTLGENSHIGTEFGIFAQLSYYF